MTAILQILLATVVLGFSGLGVLVSGVFTSQGSSGGLGWLIACASVFLSYLYVGWGM